MTVLTLHLAGPVSVTDTDGLDHTPLSMKARGALALLGTARDNRMSRIKLQDKLWSDREPEQGNASLRQTLTEIRRAFAPVGDALTTGPGWVGLDTGKIKVDLAPSAEAAPGTVEFAEDLNVRDAEFEDWLLLQRQHFGNMWRAPDFPVTGISEHASKAGGPLCVILRPATTGHDNTDRFVDVALRGAADRAADFLPIQVFSDQRAQLDFSDAIELSATGISHRGAFALQVALVRLGTGRQLWSRTFESDTISLGQQLSCVSGEVTLALLNMLSVPTDGSAAASEVSIPDIFSFSPSRLQRADDALAVLHNNPISLAWRAYIRHTQYIERFRPNRDELLAEAREFSTRALQMAPLSANALAIASIVALQSKNFVLCSDLAERAIRADQGNPLARASLSFALSATGRHAQAHAEALRARQEPLSALSPASWANFCAVTATRAHRFEEARDHSLISHGYAPGYRPALRFLSALHFKLGDVAGAEEALQKLRQLEPDFSLQLMASKSYPVASLRAAELMDVTRSRLI